jgi:thiamine-monophosphate kinase
VAPPIQLGAGGEFDLIRRFYAALPEAKRADVRVGAGDDCAVVAGDGIAVSTDVAVEGIHFRREWLTPQELGYRAAAASLSDLAAVAARPIGVLVSLVLPEQDVPDGAAGIMAGVVEMATAAGGVLLGGDVSRSPGPLVVDVVVVGEAPQPVRRSGARAGDELWVTGSLGGAAAAVASWLAGREPERDARTAFARPRPRLREAHWLAEHGALHALIDVSDGLAGDVGHLAVASQVAMVLDTPAIPVHPTAARAAHGSGAWEARPGLRLALSGGEDYELLFAAPVGTVAGLVAEFETRFGTRLTRIGDVRPGAGVVLRDEGGRERPLDIGGYVHFEVASPGNRPGSESGP